MPAIDLTPKQEAFIQAYLENGGNKTAAYRTAYDAENMQESTINVKACELFKNGKVAVRLIELQQEHQKRHNVTIDTITNELDEAREMARDKEKPEAMTGATMGKAKIHGLIKDKVEQKTTLDATGAFLEAIQPTKGPPSERDS